VLLSDGVPWLLGSPFRELSFLVLEAAVFVCHAHGNQHRFILEALPLLYLKERRKKMVVVAHLPL